MRQRTPRRGPFSETDRNVAEAFDELNELRRSRALPEYPPRSVSLAVLPRQPSHRLLRARLEI
ncbi:MAG TPA: hypothetical protein VF152_00805 [Acidimicrobiia bacterium]